MTMQATYRKSGEKYDFTPEVAVVAGEVIQLPDGRAAIAPVDIAAGDLGALQTCGVAEVLKTADIAFLNGGPVFWDASAGKAHYKKVNDRDYFLGCAYGDAAAADTTMKVVLNVKPVYTLDLFSQPFTTAVVLTAGTPALNPRGGGNEMTFSATAEAQKVDMLSVDGIALGAKAIVEGAFRVLNKGDDAALDFNVGVANGTHATDADSITESCFLHMDGNALDIKAESDDGTTEVAATDTTIDATEGAAATDRVEFWMDLRDLEDIQIYINGALVLGDSTFKLDAATGPLKLLAHLEKTSNDTPGSFAIDWLRARISEQ